jgi:uncharacterized protein YdeI (YjbR/CyaY-like superfamily)
MRHGAVDGFPEAHHLGPRGLKLHHHGPADRAAPEAADQVAPMEKTVVAYLEAAKGHAEGGKSPARNTAAPELPDDRVEALGADVALAEAIHALTPGRQRSYVINLGAKKPKTRIKRIAKFRDKIIAGTGAPER